MSSFSRPNGWQRYPNLRTLRVRTEVSLSGGVVLLESLCQRAVFSRFYTFTRVAFSAAAVGTTRPRPSQQSQHLDPPAPSIPPPTAFNQTLIQQQNGITSAHLMVHSSARSATFKRAVVAFWWCHVTPHAAASLSKALSLVEPEVSPVSQHWLLMVTFPGFWIWSVGTWTAC